MASAHGIGIGIGSARRGAALRIIEWTGNAAVWHSTFNVLQPVQLIMGRVADFNYRPVSRGSAQLLPLSG